MSPWAFFSHLDSIHWGFWVNSTRKDCADAWQIDMAGMRLSSIVNLRFCIIVGMYDLFLVSDIYLASQGSSRKSCNDTQCYT